jgi:hypothetical protein
VAAVISVTPAKRPSAGFINFASENIEPPVCFPPPQLRSAVQLPLQSSFIHQHWFLGGRIAASIIP